MNGVLYILKSAVVQTCKIDMNINTKIVVNIIINIMRLKKFTNQINNTQ